MNKTWARSIRAPGGTTIWQRWLAWLVAAVLCLGGCTASAEEGIAPAEGVEAFPQDLAGLDFAMLTKSDFEADDLPEDYLTLSKNPGRVEAVTYTTYNTVNVTSFLMGGGNAFMPNTSDIRVAKTAMVYLPAGYDESNMCYNVLYLLHGANGSPQNYLSPDKTTELQCLLDHMIEDGVIEPLIVVAATYYPLDSFVQMLPLVLQVEVTQTFPRELVESIIPQVERRYRTYAESVDLEGIVASRDHRAIAGFSLGGVTTWYVLLQQMQAFRWFLPISQASWDDGAGGTTGILDSDLSAKVLYEAVKEQGYGKEDFMLFVATGSEDEAFEVATNQMKSLLEYDDVFKVGENTSCSMMNNGTHTVRALFTYMYHILPSLFTVGTAVSNGNTPYGSSYTPNLLLTR